MFNRRRNARRDAADDGSGDARWRATKYSREEIDREIKRSKRFLWFVLAILAGLVVVMVWLIPPTAEEQKRIDLALEPPTLRVAVPSLPASLPTNADEAAAHAIGAGESQTLWQQLLLDAVGESFVRARLVEQGTEGVETGAPPQTQHAIEIEPLLAIEWQVLGAGAEVRLRLRRGIRFHDDRELTPEIGAAALAALPQVVEATVDADGWIVATLATPDPGFLTSPAFLALRVVLPAPPAPEPAPEPESADDPSGTDAVIGGESVNDDSEEDADEGEVAPRPPVLIVGTGPYRLVELVPGRKAMLERHETYHGVAPGFDRLELLASASVQERIDGIIALDVDIAVDIPASNRQSLLRYDRLRNWVTPAMPGSSSATESEPNQSPTVSGTWLIGPRIAGEPQVRQSGEIDLTGLTLTRSVDWRLSSDD